MFDNWRATRARTKFYRQTRGILNTPPVPLKDAPWTIISMVSKNDVQMYILALKSFYARIGRGKAIAIVDRDMPKESQSLLIRHFPGLEFTILEDIDTGRCQRGGTWERLLYILDRSQMEYSIQLDCDTLTVGDIDEVIQLATNNIPFTLGSEGLPFWSLEEAAQNARADLRTKNYIGIVAESRLDQYPHASSFRYVRASSGFAGFARGGFSRSEIESFHVNMERLLGERWKEWGTEQNASNFAIANSPGAVILPFPKYTNFVPRRNWDTTSFFHFFGTYRYSDGYFAMRAAEVLSLLGT